MEKGIDSHIKEYFDLPKVDVATYSPLALAYIGDGIYDLVIRSIVVGKGNTKASRLHQTTSHLVKAHGDTDSDAYGRRNGNLPQRQKCQVSDHGKKRNYVRLSPCHRL